MNNNEKKEALKKLHDETTFNLTIDEDTKSIFHDVFGENCRKAVVGQDPNAYFRFVFVDEENIGKITDNYIILGDMKELIRNTCNCFFYVYEIGEDTYHSICCIRGYMENICKVSENGGELLPPIFFTTNSDDDGLNNPNAARLEEIHECLTDYGFVDLEMINNFENTYLYLLSDYHIRREIFKKFFVREYEFEQKNKTTKETGVYDSAYNN